MWPYSIFLPRSLFHVREACWGILGMAEHLRAHRKWGMNPLVCCACAHGFCFPFWTVFNLNPGGFLTFYPSDFSPPSQWRRNMQLCGTELPSRIKLRKYHKRNLRVLSNQWKSISCCLFTNFLCLLQIHLTISQFFCPVQSSSKDDVSVFKTQRWQCCSLMLNIKHSPARYNTNLHQYLQGRNTFVIFFS